MELRLLLFILTKEVEHLNDIEDFDAVAGWLNGQESACTAVLLVCAETFEGDDEKRSTRAYARGYLYGQMVGSAE